MELLPSCIAALLLLSCSLAATATTTPQGTIERVTKQQILASLPPGGGPPVPFITSPSGKYVAYFVRTHTVPGAGGLGADFCYVEVLDTTTAAVHTGAVEGDGEDAAGATANADAAGTSVWESECRPISTVNTCTLLFSWHGLEVFDGSEEVWHGETNTDGTNFLETLELVDDGDMRIRDKDGELAWRASDEPRHAQRCGAPGSPGLATALPPFAEPLGAHSSNLPFGQEPDGNGHGADLPQAADVGSGAAAFGGDVGVGVAGPAGLGGQGAHDAAAEEGRAAVAGFGAQPLVDNSPYDSGAWKEGRGTHIIASIGVALCVSTVLGAMGVQGSLRARLRPRPNSIDKLDSPHGLPREESAHSPISRARNAPTATLSSSDPDTRPAPRRPRRTRTHPSAPRINLRACHTHGLKKETLATAAAAMDSKMKLGATSTVVLRCFDGAKVARSGLVAAAAGEGVVDVPGHVHGHVVAKVAAYWEGRAVAVGGDAAAAYDAAFLAGLRHDALVDLIHAAHYLGDAALFDQTRTAGSS
ncbi:hypothetical protein HU200_065972 [Digitaria exilis]|uniref:non-specific serine/threonine protein kinase n=1 Tax=Digitaria exilis TaxID=1010633 RepID=A0A835A7A4_9POAL|nr:hypothetical protein HU200_065972 [Digitaria exilis]